VSSPDEHLPRKILGKIAIAKPALQVPDETGIVAFEQLTNVHARSVCAGQRPMRRRYSIKTFPRLKMRQTAFQRVQQWLRHVVGEAKPGTSLPA
jgi:hypothetical protein